MWRATFHISPFRDRQQISTAWLSRIPFTGFSSIILSSTWSCGWMLAGQSTTSASYLLNVCINWLKRWKGKLFVIPMGNLLWKHVHKDLLFRSRDFHSYLYVHVLMSQLHYTGLLSEWLWYRIGVWVTLRRTSVMHNAPISGVKIIPFWTWCENRSGVTP